MNPRNELKITRAANKILPKVLWWSVFLLSGLLALVSAFSLFGVFDFAFFTMTAIPIMAVIIVMNLVQNSIVSGSIGRDILCDNVDVDSGLKALEVPRLVRASDSTGLGDAVDPVRRIFAYNIFGGWLAYIPDGDWESKNGKIKKLFWKIGIHDSIGRKCYKLSRELASNSPKPSLRVRWIRQWEILRLIGDDLLGNKQSK